MKGNAAKTPISSPASPFAKVCVIAATMETMMTTTSAAMVVTRISLTISMIAWIAKVLTVTVWSATSASKYYIVYIVGFVDMLLRARSSYMFTRVRSYLTLFLAAYSLCM